MRARLLPRLAQHGRVLSTVHTGSRPSYPFNGVSYTLTLCGASERREGHKRGGRMEQQLGLEGLDGGRGSWNSGMGAVCVLLRSASGAMTKSASTGSV